MLSVGREERGERPEEGVPWLFRRFEGGSAGVMPSVWVVIGIFGVVVVRHK